MATALMSPPEGSSASTSKAFQAAAARIDDAIDRGALSAALEVCEETLLAHPAEAEIASVAHMIYLEQGRANQAWWAIDRRGPLPQHPQVYSRLLGLRAFALQLDNWHVRAEECAARCLALDPTDAWALLALVEVYQKEDRHREVLRLLREMDEHIAESEMRAVFGLRACHALFELGKSSALLNKLDEVLPLLMGPPDRWAHWSFGDAACLFWRMRMCNASEPVESIARDLLDQVPQPVTAFDFVQRSIMALACGLEPCPIPSDAVDEAKLSDVARAVFLVGRPIVHALCEVATNPCKGAGALLQARDLFPLLGGLALHRDALELTLVHAAEQVPNLNLALSHERLGKRPSSPQAWLFHSKLLKQLGFNASSLQADLRARDLGFEQGGQGLGV